jgi:hypothetical protein
VGASSAGVRDEKPNLVGGELLGRGVVITLNYERFINNHLGLGGGLMAIGGSGGSFTILPLYASLVPGDVHSLYLSGGATFLGGGGSIQDYNSTWFLTGSFGYQFQSRGGFFVRPLFTYMTPTDRGAGDAYLIWPGLTIGGSF